MHLEEQHHRQEQRLHHRQQQLLMRLEEQHLRTRNFGLSTNILFRVLLGLF